MPQVAFDPPINQVVLGNAMGSLDLGDDEEYICEKIHELACLIDGNDDSSGYGTEFQNDVFEMHRYFWGECDCGYGEKEVAWSEAHDHEEDCFSVRLEAFENSLRASGVNELSDKWCNQVDTWAKENGYEHGWDGCATHCSCKFEIEWAEFAKANVHAPECGVIRPNFKCGDLEIRWYKYLGRGMSANRPFTRDELRGIFRKCRESFESK